MNFNIFAILLLILGAVNVFSQNPAPVLTNSTNGDTEEIYKIGDVRGNIKRKAVYLPKPPFPREALEAGADGIVKVEVVIDGEGSVVSAKAVSGHPLLFAAAEETARKTKFRRFETPDPNSRETGILNYNFVIEKAGWLRIGYDLAIIQKAPTLRPFNVPRIAKAFQPEWTGEYETLGKLAEMRRVEMETQNASQTNDRPVFVRKNAPQTSGTVQSEIRAEIRLPILNPPTGERIALAQNLTLSLQSRLASSESNLWKFNTGANIFKALEISRNQNENHNAAQILRQTLDTAPSDIPAETRAALEKLIGILERGTRTTDSPSEIGKALSILFRSK